MDKTYFDYDYSGQASSATASSSGINSTLLLILGIAILVAIVATLVCVIIILVKTSKMDSRINNISVKVGNLDGTVKDGEVGIVFCKKCGSQFKASESTCPYCGTKK